MSEYEIDSQLKEMLDMLRPVPERSPDARHRGRTRFNADLDVVFPLGAPHRGSLRASDSRPTENVALPAAVVARPAAVAAQSRPWYYRPLYLYLAVALVVVVAMFGGGFITVMASGFALPGDALYPLKLNVEEARVSLIGDPARQAELYLEYAQHRLDEMNTLAAQGQFDSIEPLAAQYNRNLARAVENARRLSDKEPERALRLENQVARSLALLRLATQAIILKAPPSMQPTLQAALDQALQLGPTVDNGGPNTPSGNGNAGQPQPSKKNSNANSNGSLYPIPTPVAPSLTNTNDNTNTSPTTDDEKDKEDKDKEEKDKDKEEKDKDKEDKEEKDK